MEPERDTGPRETPASTKEDPDRALTLRILRGMSPERKLLKAFELERLARDLRAAGIRDLDPTLSEADARARVVQELLRWHSRTS
ncbi:MAG: hypothetical protein FJ087_22665 [Deltaproteobacteria bacterium]|nr:hypothetical protein [Deltaproteobacteria bacterium]